MTLDNFAQLVVLKRDLQALYTLTCLFLVGATHPMRYIILYNILALPSPTQPSPGSPSANTSSAPSPDETTTLMRNIFLFAGCEFFVSLPSQHDDKRAQQNIIIKALQKIGKAPFTELAERCTKMIL